MYASTLLPFFPLLIFPSPSNLLPDNPPPLYPSLFACSHFSFSLSFSFPNIGPLISFPFSLFFLFLYLFLFLSSSRHQSPPLILPFLPVLTFHFPLIFLPQASVHCYPSLFPFSHFSFSLYFTLPDIASPSPLSFSFFPLLIFPFPFILLKENRPPLILSFLPLFASPVPFYSPHPALPFPHSLSFPLFTPFTFTFIYSFPRHRPPSILPFFFLFLSLMFFTLLSQTSPPPKLFISFYSPFSFYSPPTHRSPYHSYFFLFFFLFPDITLPPLCFPFFLLLLFLFLFLSSPGRARPHEASPP